MDPDYSKVTFAGVSCIEVISAENTSGKQKKKVKDLVGGNNLDVPLLDYKTSDNGLKTLNDVIIYTDKIKLWDEHITKHYEEKCYQIQRPE